MASALALVAIVCCLWCCSAGAVHFEYASLKGQLMSASPSSNGSSIMAVRQDWYTSANPYFDDASAALWLTAPHHSSLNGASISDYNNLGRIVYRDPILFSSSSFSTSFTFQIITTLPFPYCGSGMAFFIAESLQAPNSSDNSGALGLVDPFATTHPDFFAVEFDTHVSPLFDFPNISASHIGIDVNSLKSLKVADTGPNSLNQQFYLYSNLTFAVWIEYDNSSHHIQVWINNQLSGPNYTTDRPSQPLLTLQHDLSELLSKKPMYVGFSATSSPSQRGFEGHAILSWSFSNEVSAATQLDASDCGRNKALRLGMAISVGVLIVAVFCAVQWWRRNRLGHFSAGRKDSAVDRTELVPLTSTTPS